VTGQTNSAELIGRIEQDQLFLVPLDNQRHWYRYHHLFADVLCTDLERDRPGTDEELHHRAAIWHTDNDDPVEAVHHALASGDLDLATAFITRYSLLVCLQGSTELVLGWLHALGTDVCRGDVQLCVARALVAAGGNRTADMTHWAELAEAKLELPGTTEATMSSTREVLALARWSAAYSGGDVATSLRLARQATGRDDDNAPWRSASRTALGWSLYRSGQYRAAQDVLSAAAALADEDGDRRNSMVAYGIQAIIAAANQLPHEVERLAVLAVDSSASPAASVHPDAWCIAFARGWASLSQNDSERAGGYFQRSVDLLGQGSKLVEMAESLTALSMAEHILGAEDSADRHVAEARRLLQECADPGYLLADPRKMERGTVRSPAPEAEARWATLTEAEILIASLVAQGLTNRAIAKQLSLSHHTVDSHLKHAFTKLDLRSRVELTRAFLGHQMGPAS
jgi:LuxR family maltose regulon positive regulatory protein